MRNFMKEKVILVDCDGVLLDWGYAFTQWMSRHGFELKDDKVYNVGDRYGLDKKTGKMFVRMFNESATIRKLPPHKDAIKYVRKLHEEHGYVFHAITSLSTDTYAQYLRNKNLIELFGPTAFEKFIYLDTGADKDEELAKYEGTGCIWVEDVIANAECGASFGLEPLLMSHIYNEHDTIPRCDNWKQVYEYIVGC